MLAALRADGLLCPSAVKTLFYHLTGVPFCVTMHMEEVTPMTIRWTDPQSDDEIFGSFRAPRHARVEPEALYVYERFPMYRVSVFPRQFTIKSGWSETAYAARQVVSVTRKLWKVSVQLRTGRTVIIINCAGNIEAAKNVEDAFKSLMR